MSVTPDILRRLSALKLPAEQFQAVLSILADATEADPTKVTRSARNRRYYEKRLSKTSENENEGVLTPTEKTAIASDLDDPRAPVLCGAELSIALSANADKGAGAPPIDALAALAEKPLTPDAALFRRAKQVFGGNCGGQITKLKAMFGGDVGEVRQVVEQAALAENPSEYLAAIIFRGGPRANSARAGPPINSRKPPQTNMAMNALQELWDERDGSSEYEAHQRTASAGLASA